MMMEVVLTVASWTQLMRAGPATRRRVADCLAVLRAEQAGQAGHARGGMPKQVGGGTGSTHSWSWARDACTRRGLSGCSAGRAGVAGRLCQSRWCTPGQAGGAKGSAHSERWARDASTRRCLSGCGAGRADRAGDSIGIEILRAKLDTQNNVLIGIYVLRCLAHKIHVPRQESDFACQM